MSDEVREMFPTDDEEVTVVEEVEIKVEKAATPTATVGTTLVELNEAHRKAYNARKYK